VVNFACPYLTYAPTRAMVERRPSGAIKSFNQTSGFGFIACPELFEVFQRDVFIHRSQVWGINGGFPTPGLEVAFAVFLNKDQKPQGYDIQPLNGKGQKGQFGGMTEQKGAWGGKQMGGMMKGGKGDWPMASFGKGKDGKGKFDGPRMPREPPKEEDMMGQFQGIIKSFNHTNSYGFIVCEELQLQGYQDVFLHASQLGSFEVGSEVVFTAFLNEKQKPNAMNLEPVGFGEEFSGQMKRSLPGQANADPAKFQKMAF